VRAIYQDRAGDLWFGTLKHGLFRWRAGKLESLADAFGGPTAHITCFAEDRDGALHTGISEIGIAILRDGEVRFIRGKDGLPIPRSASSTRMATGTSGSAANAGGWRCCTGGAGTIPTPWSSSSPT
jgi:ligand-binding sensor domain-containing protein